MTTVAWVLGAVLMPTAGARDVPRYEYRFDEPARLAADTRGGPAAELDGVTATPGRHGGAALLDGRGGLTLPGSAELHLAGGFTLALWVRADAVGDNYCLAAKEGEFFLRLDPPNEGNQLSLFVYTGDSPEPRVRSRPLTAGRWHHVVATWDGFTAALWLDGERFAAQRSGAVPATDAPLRIGHTFRWGPIAWRGAVDELRVYDHPLPAGAVVLESLGLPTAPEPGDRAGGVFRFGGDAQGFVARGGGPLTAGDGLRWRTDGQGAALVRTGLRVPVDEADVLAVRLSANAGTVARAILLTTGGPASASFELLADGRPHSYVIDLTDQPEWAGELGTLVLVPSDQPADIVLEALELVDRPSIAPEIGIATLLPDRAINRAGRPETILATLRNSGGPGTGLTATLSAPGGVVIADPRRRLESVGLGETVELTWQVTGAAAGEVPLTLRVEGAGSTPVEGGVTLPLTPPVAQTRLDYVPPPQPAGGDLLVGCHYCPLWKQGSRSGEWELIEPFAERRPALGLYDENDPEVTDWEVKWALDHGIDFFIYCWYRRNQGQPGGVDMFLEHAIHEGLFNSRYGNQFQFTIMWENQSRGQAGVASEQDFLETLLPFWIETYFKHPSYLKIDNKPVLFIYRPEFLVDDLGGLAQVRQALDRAREVCRRAGFDGLLLLGEYRGLDPSPLQLMQDEGLDYAFQYCWHVGGDPAPDAAIAAQQSYWRRWREMSPIPYLLTISMGWDSTPWHPTHSAWRLPPSDFERLGRLVQEEMAQLPADSLGRRMVLLDNWNEFGEGHYLAPHRQYGFGYLDAVRRAFTPAADEHLDLIPEDIGRGPYDRRWQAWLASARRGAEQVTAPGGDAPGLYGWWTFDEPPAGNLALDWSGHGRGGELVDASRVPGKVGQALDCRGGCVRVRDGQVSGSLRALSLSAWIRTDLAGQEDKWFVNCIFGDGGAGFRLGLSGGRLAWAIPKTPWSHHLVADRTVPLGAWVHVAATYDGRTMRLFQDGQQVGSLDRGGPVRGTRAPLILGSFDRAHVAHFTGLLDEVRMWSRALTPEEIAAAARD